jgi:hypothetical protein
MHGACSPWVQLLKCRVRLHAVCSAPIRVDVLGREGLRVRLAPDPAGVGQVAQAVRLIVQALQGEGGRGTAHARSQLATKAASGMLVSCAYPFCCTSGRMSCSR